MNPIDQLKAVLCDPNGKCCIDGSDEDRAIVDRALQALAKPEQEPVAMLKSASVERAENAAKKLRQRNNAKPWDDLDRETVFAIDGLVAFANFQFNRANTAQPRKPWVGLTDEDTANICMQGDINNWHDEQVINAVEAKLKEINT